MLHSGHLIADRAFILAYLGPDDDLRIEATRNDEILVPGRKGLTRSARFGVAVRDACAAEYALDVKFQLPTQLSENQLLAYLS